MRANCPLFIALIVVSLLDCLSAGGRLPAALAADEKESAAARQPACLFLGSRAPDAPAPEKAPAASTPAQVDIPRADSPFDGTAETHARGLEAGLPATGEGAQGRSQRAAGAGRRRGFRQPLDLRRPVPDADALPGWPAGPALQPVPRDGPVLPTRAALLSGGTTTRWASARSPSSPADGRATTRPGRRARRASHGSSRATAIPPPRSASGTSRPTTSRAPPARSTAGRAGWGSTTSAASSAARRASTTRC